jgi:hypothetical protein
VVWWTLFWWLLVRLNRSLSPPGVRAWNLPLAYLCTNYAVTSYFTSGLESPLALLAGAVLAHFFVRPESRVWSFAVALCPLVRPELAVAAVFSCAYAGWRLRRFPRFLVAMIALVNMPWLVFRVWYYADLLPNTFYLKDTDRWDWGWTFLLDATMSYWFPVFALVVAAAIIVVMRRRGGGGDPAKALHLDARAAMTGLAALLTLYVVRIGGASIHMYYLWTPAVLAVATSAGLAEHLFPHSPPRARLAMVALTLGVLLCHSTVLDRHPLVSSRHHSIGSLMLIEDPSHHRVVKVIAQQGRADTIDDQRAFAEELARTGYRATKADGYCATIYRDFQTRFVHRYGLTDAFLARTIAPERRRGHKPTLWPLAMELATLLSEGPPGPGLFREAVVAGRAPDWIRNNLPAIELIARKVYHRHDFAENLRLALTPIPAIEPGDVEFPDTPTVSDPNRPIPSKLRPPRSRAPDSLETGAAARP